MNFDPNQMSKEQLQTLANRIYPGIAMYARDVNLPPELAGNTSRGRSSGKRPLPTPAAASWGW